MFRNGKKQKIQIAEETPFDNSTNGFTSDDVQHAIEESGKNSRGPTIAAFDGTASSGRWLEFYSNNPSNNNPFIVAENVQIAAVSISASSNSTGTVTIFKNGASSTTISLSANRKAATSGLTISFSSLDEISVQVTSGSISRPTVFMFIRTVV